jgi:hypothetical protein
MPVLRWCYRWWCGSQHERSDPEMGKRTRYSAKLKAKVALDAALGCSDDMIMLVRKKSM